MNGKTIGIFIAFILTIFVTFLYISFQVTEPIVENVIVNKIEEKRKPFLVTGDLDPGDNTGFCTYLVFPHVEDMAGTYSGANVSNASAYEIFDCLNCSGAGETPYGAGYPFDLYFKYAVTNEDGYWTGNQTRNPGYNWLNLTCTTPLGFTNYNVSNEFFIANNTSMAWYCYVLQDADGGNGTGFTIIEGQQYNVTAEFYVMRVV